MRITNLSVGLEMRRSNGDYGSDKAEVTLTAVLDEPGENAQMALQILLDIAREYVESDLKRSPSLAVRRGMLPEYRTCSRCNERLADEVRSYLHPACREAEDAEREEHHQRQLRENAERWAQSNANAEEREVAGVAADDDGEDDLPL